MAEEVVAPAEPKAAPVEAPKAAPAPAGEATPAPDAAPKETRTYSQEDLDRITAKVKKNERYRTRKEVEAFYQGRESAAPKPVERPAPSVEDKPPTREQFESYEQFLDAKAAHIGAKAAKEQRAKDDAEQKARTEREARDERVKSFQAKVNEKYPDLAERAESIAHVEMPPGMGDAISESEFGPDILNHFAENPKDFERIAALSPSAAIREVGKLEARLEGAAKPAPAAVPDQKNPSRAPAPITPVAGTAVTGSDDLASLVNDPMKWKAVRDKQAHKARTGGQAK